MKDTNAVTLAMAKVFDGDIGHINHAMKVYGLARTIAMGENLSEAQRYILDVTTILHDIAIPLCMEKYGSGRGDHQQVEGPGVATEILTELGEDAGVIEEVCFLIAHHHTYAGIDRPLWQILVEADFLVNMDEGHMSGEQIAQIQKNIFRTDCGGKLLERMFPVIRS